MVPAHRSASGVRPWRPHRRPQDSDALGGEDGIEGGGELRILIANHGPELALLRSPWPRLSGETVAMRPRRPRSAPLPRSAFAGFRFPPDVIVLAVRWCLRFGLSYRDVEELLAERGVEVDHVTIYRWVQRFTAIDQFGQVIDAFVSPRRDAKAARRFFEQAIATTKVPPVEVVTDRAATYPIVLEDLLPAAWHCTEQYADNGIECDHGRLKARAVADA